MIECPFCETEIEEKYAFCPSCDQRVKCENCGDYLLKGKDRCYVCGEPIEEEGNNTMNTFELREERHEEGGSREVNIEISNEGMENAGRIVERLFGTGQQFDGTRKIQTEADDEQEPPTSLPPDQEVSEVEEEDEELVSKDDEVLSTADGRGKPLSTDASIRNIDARDVHNNYEMTIVALYDITEVKNEDHAKPALIYKHLGKIFKRVRFSESSNRTYLRNYKGEYFQQDDNGGYYLSTDGLDKAEEILENNE